MLVRSYLCVSLYRPHKLNFFLLFSWTSSVFMTVGHLSHPGKPFLGLQLLLDEVEKFLLSQQPGVNCRMWLNLNSAVTTGLPYPHSVHCAQHLLPKYFLPGVWENVGHSLYYCRIADVQNSYQLLHTAVNQTTSEACSSVWLILYWTHIEIVAHFTTWGEEVAHLPEKQPLAFKSAQIRGPRFWVVN